MWYKMRIPGPVGLSETHPRILRGPTGIEYGSELQPRAAQSTYNLLSSAWAKHWNYYSDCLATCQHVARQVCKARKISYQWSLVKMFKHDNKWCKGNEHTEAIARLNRGYRDTLNLLQGQIVVYQGPPSGSPTNSVMFSLEPGMCVYTAEGYQKENGRWRWALRHMRMYIGKGEYRDNSRHRRHGGPVWGSSPISLYVVLGVWDPFGKIRPFL